MSSFHEHFPTFSRISIKILSILVYIVLGNNYRYGMKITNYVKKEHKGAVINNVGG
jgi:hypothetical protein